MVTFKILSSSKHWNPTTSLHPGPCVPHWGWCTPYTTLFMFCVLCIFSDAFMCTLMVICFFAFCSCGLHLCVGHTPLMPLACHRCLWAQCPYGGRALLQNQQLKDSLMGHLGAATPEWDKVRPLWGRSGGWGSHIRSSCTCLALWWGVRQNTNFPL